MVFESIVADLLNRFLGDFVDNLDASQLNIGIWGGDVTLTNLEVKETALDDFDLPFKLKFGYLSTLILKIPWKSLYTEPVIANVEGLYLIVVPNKGVVYNDEKAKKNEQESKQKTLLRLEENRKKQRKPADAAADSFTEKMVAQIIKNLQIKIRSIHIRYEDKYTNRNRPFAAGITLEGLDFKTTDANWKETIHKGVVQIVFKLISLNNLSIYWNSESELFSDLNDREEIKQEMYVAIAAADKRPVKYKYILEPITMETKLSMNQKPEADGTNWKIPKIDLKLSMEMLTLSIDKLQYQDILLFLEGQERFTLAARYLKYRPNLNEYHGYYKEWWYFAYKSILEEMIRRKKKNWSWERMKNHRKLLRDYREAWLRKQTEKNLGSNEQKIIEKAEYELDVFNINIARQQADMEIDRRGLTRNEDQPQGWISWAKSWWSTDQNNAESKTMSGVDIVSQFEKAMTPEEKAKLFAAIDYQENTPPTDYPKHFIENVVSVELKSLMIVVANALSMKFSTITANVQQRPSARAINIRCGIQSIAVNGCGQPMLSMVDDSSEWLNMLIDTNPYNRDEVNYDQYIKLVIAPTLLKYHAPAINTAIDALKPPESVRLNQLTAAAMSRYEEVKTHSVTGLAHAVEAKVKLVLDIHIAPATIVISETGIFGEDLSTLVVDLGLLTVRTIEDSAMAEGLNEADRRIVLVNRAYDKFTLKVTNVQIILAENYENAMSARNEPLSKFHILRPTGMDISIHKSSIDDMKLAKIRILGALPDIIIKLSDERLLQLLKLILSIPTPPPEEQIKSLGELTVTQFERSKLKDRAKIRAIMEVDEVSVGEKVDSSEEISRKSDGSQRAKELNEQQVQLEMDLTLNQVAIIIGTKDAIYLSVEIRGMGCRFQMRTFDMVLFAYLGGLTVEQPLYKSLTPGRDTLYLIDNTHGSEENLLDLKFVQANPESPFFVTEYKSMEQAIDVSFKTLTITLHQESLMELKQFGETLRTKIGEIQKEKQKEMASFIGEVEIQAEKLSRRLSQLSQRSFVNIRMNAENDEELTKISMARRERQLEMTQDDHIIKTCLNASFNSLELFIGSNKCLDTVLAISIVRASLMMKVKTVKLMAGLQAITIQDRTGTTAYENLLSVCGDREMFTLDFTQYNRSEKEKNRMSPSDLDMIVVCRFAQMRFIFLNLWLTRLLKWLEPFQAEAARAAAQAQAIAVEKATEAAQNVRQIMEQSPPRIHLDIELAAPTILVPQKSTSFDALIFDFGKLTVKNSFIPDPQQIKTVVDSMLISLTDVNFAIGLLSKKSDKLIIAKCEILKPVSFSLSVKRNLCFEWYKDIPEICVDANLPIIELNMSQEDYAIVMKTLSGNLAECAEPNELNIVKSQPCSDISKRTENKEQKIDEGKKTEIKFESLAAKTHSPAKRVAFAFTMDEIVASLYSGSSNLLESSGVVVRTPDQAFASMRLLQLIITGSLMDDGKMDVNISLGSFTMNDERKEETRITRLLDKKVVKSDNLHPEFILIHFQQTSNSDKIIDFSSSPFFLCLCPEFLGVLTSFFTVRFENEDAEIKAVPKSVSNQAEPKTGKTTPSGAITMNCKMREVEIILIEDSNKPDSTQALVLSFNVDVEAKHVNGVQIIAGGIKNLQIISSYYQESKRSQNPYQVLNRVELTFEGTIDDKTKSQHFNVDITPMHLKVSPAIIRLLSAVSAEFSAANQSTNGREGKRRPILKKYPNYWEKKKIDRRRYWWFKLNEDAEVEADRGIDIAAGIDHQEQANIKMGSLIITLEAGTGITTIPMILVESSMLIVASDWSSLLKVDARLSFQVSYYNEGFSIWEPVIEPVEIEDGNWQSWQIDMEMRTHSDSETVPLNGGMHLPKRTINFKASNILNITVTKSFMQLLNRLSDAFEKAAKQITPPKTHQLPGSCPFLILNNTGISVKVGNSDTLRVAEDDKVVDATACAFVDLDILSENKQQVGSNQTQRTELRLIFDDLETEREINVKRAEIRTVTLPRKGSGGQQWKMVIEIKVENFRRLITLRSAVQFVNHMDIAYEVYSMRDTMLDLCGVADTTLEPLDIALPLLYNGSGQLYLKPANDSFEMSNESLNWYKFEDKARYLIRCDQVDNPKQGNFAALSVEELRVKAERSREFIDRIFIVHIYPTVTLHNLLPFLIRLLLPFEYTLNGGEQIPLNIIPGQKINMELIYRNEIYRAEMILPSEYENLEVISFCSIDEELNLGVHWNMEHRRLDAQIYAPYWFVNNTGKTLKYMENKSNMLSKSASCLSCRKSALNGKVYHAIVHEPFSDPAIINFDSSDFLNKKKAKIQIADSLWSDEFPLDAVGNAGRVICKTDEQEFEITIDIKVCQSGLTKVVVFTPFYFLNNISKFPVEVKEFGGEVWTKVESESCVGIWPRQTQKRKYLIARYVGTAEESGMFPFTENFEGFCQINNEYLGIYVTCTLGESSSIIQLEPFNPGMAPAFIMNATNLPVEFGQKGSPDKKLLDPWECCFFTWMDVTRNRELEWKSGNITECDGLYMNNYNSYKVSDSPSGNYYWVSFLNGRQRVFLFTDDLAVMTTAYEAYEIEPVDQQIEISLQGIGLSLVNNINSEEIIYMGIASSAVIWEQFVRSRFRLFTIKQMEDIENSYQNWLLNKVDLVKVDKFDIDFSRMVIKKKKSETNIRRQFETGLWIQLRQSPHQMQIHLKVNHLQVDNQLPACVFPCILNVVAPPKSIVADNAPKPFMEFSFTMRKSEYSNIVEIKYLHLLIQEFSIQVDQGFINAILSFLSNDVSIKPYTKDIFEKDMEMTKDQLSQMALTTAATQQKAFYDDLHISPLMIHLSFSQGGSSGKNKASAPIQSEFINVLLKSVGVTLTELQDVVFKLAFFERKFMFYNRQQLQSEIISHYMKQAIKQLYVLVLGLDIIGNPFGLVRDLSTGVEDFFYQPFQGAIQGPEEFAEGVALGVKSLFSATVGGASGAVSRITGTLGKGVAALTLDEDYQRKRQQAINRRPKNFGEGMARGAKGVGQGLYEGITGIVSKPLEGARTSGVGGFMVGLGKGLVGAVVRPVSGVVDFASSSMDAVKTVTAGSNEITALRPPRVIFADNIVRPYSFKIAAGSKIFKETDRGAIADTDAFVAHAPISSKLVFIVTDKRVLLVKKSDLVGSWDVDWQIMYSEMKAPERIEKGVKLELKKKQKGFLGLGDSNGKMIQFNDKNTAEEITKKLINAYEAEIQGCYG